MPRGEQAPQRRHARVSAPLPLAQDLPAAAPVAGTNSWLALAILFAIGACSMGDRYVLAILLPGIKQDLQLSDAQAGLLVGPAIAILYAVMGLPLGRLADRLNRARFLAGCLGLWSLFTGLGGFAANLWQLALSRVGVSAAEGGCAPTTMSLLADFFPAGRRAIAGAIYSCSTSAGILIAFAAGGYVAEHWGWRATLLAAAVPGIVLGAVTLVLLREPVRGGLDGAAAPSAPRSSLWNDIRFFFSLPIYRRALLGAGLIHVATSVITAWGPTFLSRKFDASSGLIGAYFGVGLALIGASCVLASGWLIGRIGPHRFGRSLRLVALLEVAAALFAFVALWAPTLPLAVAGFSLLYGFSNIYLPTQFVVVQNYLPATMRATGSATGSLLVILFVQGLIPPLVGLLSDMLQPGLGERSLQLAMLVMLPAILLSAAQYARAARAADSALPIAAPGPDRRSHAG
jgi:predicted MFS family arabinose efflux permease